MSPQTPVHPTDCTSKLRLEIGDLWLRAGPQPSQEDMLQLKLGSTVSQVMT